MLNPKKGKRVKNGDFDLQSWERYISNSRNKDLTGKSVSWGIDEKSIKLKMAQIAATIEALETLNPESLCEVYSVISAVWS